MLNIVRKLLFSVLAAGVFYQVFSILMIALFGKRQNARMDREEWPPVSILKPICGKDQEIVENLRSFCVQDYPQYEVLMGVGDPNDEAMPAAEETKRSFPRLARVVIQEGTQGANRKMANLIGLEAESRFELIAVSDSDMRVGPDYLKTIVSEYLKESGTGLVTCPYMVKRPVSMGSAFEALTIACDLFPAILVARRLEGMTFGLGASLLLSKPVLEKIGGFVGLADYLADDYQIGYRIRRMGYRVVLSQYVMDDANRAMTIGDHIRHQLRWAVTYRASRPKGFLAYGITNVFPLAFLFALLRGRHAIQLLVAVLSLRVALALLVGVVLIPWKWWFKDLALLPVKDILSFAIWLISLFIKTVSWRGRLYQILRDGRMKEIESPFSPRFTPP
jgi:ceramide glucosyltransferase